MKIKLFTLAALVLSLTLCAACALGATANAVIIAPDTAKIVAPFSGTLLPFDLKSGDEIAEGAALFELDTTPVYAPISGTVGAVFAAVGDDAAGLSGHYGAIAFIEPEYPLYIAASTRNADEDEDNHYLHVGETLYLKRSGEKGTGVIVSVHDEDYTVEIRTGDFDFDSTVSCFRESSMPSDSKTGEGKVKRFDDVPVTTSGRISAVHVQPGDQVLAGDLLFETVDAQSAPGASPVVAAPVSGAVMSLNVTPGAQVYRGQLLCEIADLSSLELSAEIDELDLGAVSVGGQLTFSLDAYGSETFTGTVTQIRPLGTARQNAAYFDVRITLPQGKLLLPGMNATVHLAQ